MKARGWLAAVIVGAVVFVVGVVMQLTGSPHVGLAISMVGAILFAGGGLVRPRR